MTTFVAPSEIEAVVNLYSEDVFALLGLHERNGTFFVNAFLPQALAVEVIGDDDVSLGKLQNVHPAGFFSGPVSLHERRPYRLKITYSTGIYLKEDPYRFGSSLSALDLYLFGEGTHEQTYRWMGAHVLEQEGVKGTRFAVWAPNAQRVSVVGDFNYWDGRHHMMRKHVPSGIWELFIPGVAAGRGRPAGEGAAGPARPGRHRPVRPGRRGTPRVVADRNPRGLIRHPS